eukprot:TRINITY_DN19058_c0_g2_i4.p1 TRINITY_DN19058_c0_g2~~TRINITY_DN19058_c0_g2_i4.p1  ORF type:complete len:217 (-),score=29.43 TRINITY_DN19058_c0_g2_i4:123-773(-)
MLQQCEMCPETYSCKSEFIKHVKSHHTVQFTCDVCHKSFASEKSFKNHKMLHDGVRPFKCEMCPRTYITKNRLNKHVKTHTERFTCDICNKSFKSNHWLKHHKMLHTGSGGQFLNQELMEESFDDDVLMKQEIMKDQDGFYLHQNFDNTANENINNTEDEELSHFKRFIKEELKEEENGANENCDDSEAETDSQDSQMIDCGQFLNQELKEEDAKF